MVVCVDKNGELVDIDDLDIIAVFDNCGVLLDRLYVHKFNIVDEFNVLDNTDYKSMEVDTNMTIFRNLSKYNNGEVSIAYIKGAIEINNIQVYMNISINELLEDDVSPVVRLGRQVLYDDVKCMITYNSSADFDKQTIVDMLLNKKRS